MRAPAASLALALALAPGLASAVAGAGVSGGPEAVGAVWQDGTFACSGVLYAPDRVVTAAHCVEHLSASDPMSEVRFPGGAVAVSTITLHPDHFAAAEADLAVLWLAGIAPATPLPVRGAAPDEDWDLWTLQVAGWGGASPDDLAAGADLRSFAALPEDLTLAALVFDGGDAFVCDGDSGGAVLRVDGGAEELVGVVIGGPGDCDGPGISVRVDAFAGFLADPEGTQPGDRPFGEDDDGEGAGDDPTGGPSFGSGLDVDGGAADFSSAGCAVGGVTSRASWALGLLLVLIPWRRRRGSP